MDLAPARHGAGDAEMDLSTIQLVVLRATAEELAAHHQQLEAIDKTAKAGCVWKRLEVAEVTAGSSPGRQ
jgi:DNA polymerase-3 subunit epsilon